MTHRLRDHRVLKAAGVALGREGMSQRVIAAVADWQASGSTLKGAIILAGRLKAIAGMTAADDYWSEKMSQGYQLELHKGVEIAAASSAPPKTAGASQ